ncbi:MAG: phage tail length tape measure family protein, partial [Acidocella sp.]|nr:phage tail length tape measure family protein [Acidocella sp.]
MALNTTEIAQVQINANVSGANQVAGLTRDMNGLQMTITEMTKKQQAFMASLAAQSQTFGKSRSEVLAMKAEMLGLSAAANPLIGSLKQMGIDGEHSFKSMITHGGVFRELLVLIHESLIMGNWSRFGGSMMVLAERTGISASIFTAFGVAVLAGVASMGALVAAMITGEMESTKFARSIALTGDMAGITEGQFNAMAETIGGQIPGKVLMARTAMQDLISTGQFTGQTLADVARASVEFAQYSGETAAQAVKQFDTMKEGVAKWAEKTNEQYHFITAAQFEYIQTLENQGQVQAAADAAANDFYQHLAQSGTQNLGILEKAWLGLGAAIHGTWDELQNVGRASTLQDQISQLQMTEHSVRGNRKPYDDQIAALQAKLAAQEKAASDAAKNDQVQQLGIKA